LFLPLAFSFQFRIQSVKSLQISEVKDIRDCIAPTMHWVLVIHFSPAKLI
jgi:hypothetical protein